MPSACVCFICNLSFKRNRDLSRHINTEHNPNVPIVYCPYPQSVKLEFSASSTSPTVSWNQFTGPHPLRCKSSAKRGQETNLTTHMLKHVGYRWPCPKCGTDFSDRASISRHRTKHKHPSNLLFRDQQQEIQKMLLMKGNEWLRSVGTPSIGPQLRNSGSNKASGSRSTDSSPGSKNFAGSGSCTISSSGSAPASTALRCSSRTRNSAVRTAFRPYSSPSSRAQSGRPASTSSPVSHGRAPRHDRTRTAPFPHTPHDPPLGPKFEGMTPPDDTEVYAAPLLSSATSSGFMHAEGEKGEKIKNKENKFEDLIDPQLLQIM